MTYLNVKEDALQLFGFLTKDDLEIFKLVIGVSGIGPKGGLNILSCMSPDDLRFAIMSGDAKAISAAPGIGKKTAEKLILELRDKVDIEDVLNSAAHGEEAGQFRGEEAESGMQAEAVQALVALGYGNAESLRAVINGNMIAFPRKKSNKKGGAKGKNFGERGKNFSITLAKIAFMG